MSTPARTRAAKADRVYTPPTDARRRSRAEHRRMVKTDRVYTEPEPGTTAASRRARRAAAAPTSVGEGDGTGRATDAPGAVEPAPPPEPARGNGGGSRPGLSIAGFIVGAFAWGYGINWLRGGKAQANGWVAAKFINRPYGGGGGASTSTAAPAGGNNTLPASTVRRAPG